MNAGKQNAEFLSNPQIPLSISVKPLCTSV